MDSSARISCVISPEARPGGCGAEDRGEGIVGQGEAQREQGGAESQRGVDVRRRGQRQADEHRRGGETGVAEDDAVTPKSADGALKHLRMSAEVSVA